MWLRRSASRRTPSMVARASWPANSSPVTAARCEVSPGRADDGVVDEGRARLGDDGAGVADLAPALGVERGAVEEDLGLTGVVRVQSASTATTRAGAE